MHSPPKRVGWKAGTIAVAALGGLVRLAGCDSDNSTADMTTGGPDMAAVTPGVPPTSAATVATFDRPLAAVVSPDGVTAYVTAHEPGTGAAALYSVPVAGGSPTKISTSKPLNHPLSMAISPSGQTLYIADSAGGTETGNDDAGTVYSSDLNGSISGATYTGFRAPGGIAVSADGSNLFITGFEKGNAGEPAVFTVSASGGTASVLAKGMPLVNPSAVVSGADGAVYVVDALSLGSDKAGVIKVQDGKASLFNKTSLKVGFASGIALIGPGSTDFLITGNNGVGAGVVYQLTTAGVATPLSLTGGTYFDPATIARAANANVWVVVDTVNATQASGQMVGSLYKLVPPS